MILYVGKHVSEEISTIRAIPPNPACSRRMERIASLFSKCGEGVKIISQGNSLRIPMRKPYFYRKNNAFKNGIFYNYLPTPAIPYFSGLWNIVVFPFFFLLLLSQKDVKVVFYNFYPSYIIPSFFSRLLGKTVILELEDISRPDLWISKTIPLKEKLEQTVGWCSMKIMLFSAHKIIVPTKRFITSAKSSKPFLIVTGSGKVKQYRWPPLCNGRMIVLLGGKLCKAHGLELFLNMLRCPMRRNILLERFEFHICGRYNHCDNLYKEIVGINVTGITFHGYISDESYSNLLSSTHIGLVLQDPNGRDAFGKTPSKGYEYLCNGKALVVTEIGDFTELSDSERILLSNYTYDSLFQILTETSFQKFETVARGGHSFAMKNFDTDAQVGKMRAFLY